MHWLAALLVFAGSWLSGFFIIATDAWMQYPVGYTVGANGDILLRSFRHLIFNPWTLRNNNGHYFTFKGDGG